ncbi:TapY2 family type IVa secretion system protein [Shewanella sp. UCD-KL21]|uniref:TapY2 family type IVa secretion system protein n=1 Tax=Shewanella sp. UCD-KL21 TaxID=1917164 RepID=UPI000970AF90|nr:TapY2 family type IVa secretion system protein [Shewanella sp. UCD-KL21]
MIKVITTTFCMLSMLAVSPVWAAKQDYKCFITSSTKGDEVVFYRWNTKDDIKLKAGGLIGKQRADRKGKKYFIKDVQECVALGQDFVSEKAQAVDKKTLR